MAERRVNRLHYDKHSANERPLPNCAPRSDIGEPIYTIGVGVSSAMSFEIPNCTLAIAH